MKSGSPLHNSSRKWKTIFPIAFALVYLPPKKEAEDWQTVPRGVSLADKDLETVPARPAAAPAASSKNEQKSSRFSFDGRDTMTFVLKESRNPEWETKLPGIEREVHWPSGAWSGLSLQARELHHFYIREHKNGPEPKYRVYTLAPNFENIDFELCDAKTALLLQKELSPKPREKNSYRITRVSMVSSQELKRDKVWSLELASAQDLLKIVPENCEKIVLDAYPNSLVVKLK